MEATIDPQLLADPVFQRVMQDALAIQDRFAAEPVYAKTGTGYLKSAGVGARLIYASKSELTDLNLP